MVSRIFGFGCCLFAALVAADGTDLCPAQQPESWPTESWQETAPAEAGMNARLLQKARDYALTGGGSGLIVRHGRLVMSWGDLKTRYDLKSTTKSIGVTALGLALADGLVAINDPAVRHHPDFGVPPESNRGTGWIDEITLRHLATHTAGFGKSGGYTKLLFAPGTKWAYSDGGPNWLAECLTLCYRRDLDELLFDRVFSQLGISRQDLRWRKNAYRPPQLNGLMRREFGSGIHANVDAMARIGLLYLRNGRWRDQQILPVSFVKSVRQPDEKIVGLPEAKPEQYGNASDHYGWLWWNNGDGTLKNVPRDAFWSWGLYDSLILVIPSLDIVAVRAGKSWKRGWASHYGVLRPFFEPIAQSARADGADGRSEDQAGHGATRSAPKKREEARGSRGVPYPPSPAIAGIRWAPPDQIIRLAPGSDNWPITWGDDDRLYTAYGDGRGFRPFVERKLSMGLAVLTGSPPSVKGANLRSASFERLGNGERGPKVSSLLMVDGVLYALVRNTKNSQLIWSTDHGRTWTWEDWKFTTSFGYPVFLNDGKDYAGSTEPFVYIYSHDSPSAYRRADRMVLARVPRDRIRRRSAYEFYVGQQDGRVVWSRDIRRRGAVFEHAGGCYRSSVCYHGGSGRYLWCQTGEGSDPRFAGGLGIYDAPKPWGPWTTVFFTRKWDVGPGETSSFPTKWMSDDGRVAYFVFSGKDSFSIRRAEFLLRN